MSAYWKIPLQALILLVGVMIFVYHQFQAPPLLYNTAHERAVQELLPDEYAALQGRFEEALVLRDAARRAAGLGTGGTGGTEANQPPGADARQGAAMADFLRRDEAVQAVRAEALAMAEEVTGEAPRDVNYIIPRFVLGEMPVGLAGLFIAAVIAAAMSSISSELNSLSTTTVIDFYRRWFRRGNSDAHYLLVSKAATGLWGLFACIVAVNVVGLGSLIEVVNRLGSYFYGSILGVFLLAMIPRAQGAGAFAGLVAGMAAVGMVEWRTDVAFLWLNVVGAGVVVGVGMLASARSHAK